MHFEKSLLFFRLNYSKIIKISLYEGDNMSDKTIEFKLNRDGADETKSILTSVYDALHEKGYNPISQLVGYILSEDPTYITTHNNARSLICKIDRDDLLQTLLKSYLNKE